MIFYVFYSKFCLHDSLKNAFSEHLEWLKFKKILGGFHSTNPLTGGLRHPQDSPAVLHIAYSSVKKGALKLKIQCPVQCILPSPLFLKQALNAIPVAQTSHQKQLGLYFDDKLNFRHHVKEIISKANKGIRIMKKLKNILSRNALLTIYKSVMKTKHSLLSLYL